MEICCMTQGSQTGALRQPRGVGWSRRWEGASRGTGHMYASGWFMLMVWQKPAQYCKTVILQLKINFKKDPTVFKGKKNPSEISLHLSHFIFSWIISSFKIKAFLNDLYIFNLYTYLCFWQLPKLLCTAHI